MQWFISIFTNVKLIISFILIIAVVVLFSYYAPETYEDYRSIILSVASGAALTSFIYLHLLKGTKSEVEVDDELPGVGSPASRASRASRNSRVSKSQADSADSALGLRSDGGDSASDNSLLQHF